MSHFRGMFAPREAARCKSRSSILAKRRATQKKKGEWLAKEIFSFCTLKFYMRMGGSKFKYKVVKSVLTYLTTHGTTHRAALAVQGVARYTKQGQVA